MGHPTPSIRYILACLALAWPAAARAASVPDPSNPQDNPMMLEDKQKSGQDLISALEDFVYKIQRIDSGLTQFEQHVNRPDRDRAKTDLPTKTIYSMELEARNKLDRAYTALLKEAIPSLLQARKLIEDALKTGDEAYQQIRPLAEDNYPLVSQTLKASVDSMRPAPPAKGSDSGADPNPFQNQEGKIQQMQDPLQQIDNLISQAEGPLGMVESLKDDIRPEEIHDKIKESLEKLAQMKRFGGAGQGTQNGDEGPSPQLTLEEIKRAIKAMEKALLYAQKLTTIKDPKAIPGAKEALAKLQQLLKEANTSTQDASTRLPKAKQEVDRSNQGLEALAPQYPTDPATIGAQAQASIDRAKGVRDQADQPTQTARDKSREAGQILQQSSRIMAMIDKFFGQNPERAQNLPQTSERPSNLADVYHTNIQDKSQTSSTVTGPRAGDQLRDAARQAWDGR